MPSEATNERTKQEWRELGFFYERDDEAQSWKFVGSKAGLLSFAKALRFYAGAIGSDDAPGDHQHYGPYWYLTVTLWTEAEITDRGICGPPEDLARLAAIIEARVTAAEPGSSISIKEEFATRSSYVLVLEVGEDGFDPSTADPELTGAGSSKTKRKHLTTHTVRGPNGWIPYFALEAFGQSLAAIQEWRARQPQGEPNGLKDFFEAFGLCFDCKAHGAIPAGVSPPSPEEIAEYGGKLPSLLPKYEQCTTCDGTGKAPRSRWKSVPKTPSDGQ